MHTLIKKYFIAGEFPGSLVVRTQRFYCQGPGFDPWSGNYDPANNTRTKKPLLLKMLSSKPSVSHSSSIKYHHNKNNNNKKVWDFPGGPVFKNPPTNAGALSNSRSGKTPRAAGQWSLCTTTPEPTHLEPVLRNKRSHHRETLAHSSREINKKKFEMWWLTECDTETRSEQMLLEKWCQ